MSKLQFSSNTAVAVLVLYLILSVQVFAKPRLIILVQEGLGHELIEAARNYSEDKDLWDWRLDNKWLISSVSTLPLTTQQKPDGRDPETRLLYNPTMAWNGSKSDLDPNQPSVSSTFSGYKWLIENSTDKNQSATAFSSGISTFNTSVNWLPYPAKDGGPMPAENLMMEWAHRNGLKTGLISDMPFTHSTNLIIGGIRSRDTDDSLKCFHELLESPYLDLYASTGHPKYNELGQALSRPEYKFCSQNNWQELRSRGRSNGWDVVFGDDNLMGISTKKQNHSDKRLVVMQFGDTTSTQAIRADSSGLVNNLNNSIRFQLKMALSFLDESEKGFVLVVHIARLPYLLRDDMQMESINEVVNTFEYLNVCEDWVDSNGGWNDTSLVLTSLYEYGLVWGSDSSTFPFSQIGDRGKKRLPGFRVNHTGPTAALTPLLVRGALTQQVMEHVKGDDPIYGKYMHITDLSKLLRRIDIPVQSKVE